MSQPRYIVFGSPTIDREAIAAVARTMETRWIGTGPRVHEFEAGIDTAIAYAHALGCTQVNCLAGIRPASVA